jgi:ribosomal RNA-processing protein 36
MSKNKRKDRQASNPESTNATSALDDIRAKLREARELKASALTKKEKEREAKEKKRASKHAPMEQSSKRAVTRRRTAVELPPAPKARDPRFDAAVMGHSGAGKHPSGGKAYAFLDEYRASELRELKEQLSKTKNAEQKEVLKQQIRSAQDRMRAAANKKREMDVQAEHKKREKQMIREGKKATPYYLKKSDLKKQVLEKKFGEMGSRERGKALERRRKKMASKERKEMPWERRGFGEEDGGMPNAGKRRRLE